MNRSLSLFIILSVFVILISTISGCIPGYEVREKAVTSTSDDVVEVEDATDPSVNEIPLELPIDDPKIIIWKSERRLELFSGNQIVREWPVGLGFAPEGDKEKEGDGRTPEGEFYLCIKNPHSDYYLSLGISYPSIDDGQAALWKEIITEDEYLRIAYAIDNKLQPPWNTALGGEIFIHGHGSSSDWTLGCIALDDPAIEELYEAVPVGTVVTINP